MTQSGSAYNVLMALRTTLLFLAAAALAACGGGDGVDIAGGQDADPVAVDIPIAYVKRPVPPADDPNSMSSGAVNLLAREPGAGLYVRERASVSAVEQNITAAVGGPFADIKDLAVSFDGTRLAFAMRTPILPGVDDEDLPTWNIWEYEFGSQILRRVIADNSVAEAGHDRFPQYLPDGRLVFSSTRQTQTLEVLVNEGRGQFSVFEESDNEPAFLLHTMNADGSDIRQISFNASHDLSPIVMRDGKIVFTRWDQAVDFDELNLYRINPDGTELELLYGAKSHFTGTNGTFVEFLDPREMPDGKVLTILRPRAGTQQAGQMVAIDINAYVEQAQLVVGGVPSGPAQTAVSANDVNTAIGPSLGGRYASAFPLWDGTGRILVSWSPCLSFAANNTAQSCAIEPPQPGPQPDAAYGLWVYNTNDNIQSPIIRGEAGVWITDVVAAEPRARQQIRFDTTGQFSAYPDLADEGWGLLSFRSVYDIDGVDATGGLGIPLFADPFIISNQFRPARFLRVVKRASIPDETILDVPRFAFGISDRFGMREILGYALIEPDGSARVRVPANVPITIDVLDANGRRLAGFGHDNWLQTLPGAETSCNGCHDATTGLSHGRSTAFASAYSGATSGQFQNATTDILPLIGETMAQARTRVSCATDNCSAFVMTPDIEYQDFWSPFFAIPETPFSYAYTDLETPAPISGACAIDWDSSCRIVINYEDHIHPLWSLPRPNVDTSGMDRQCDGCHTPSVNMGGMLEDAPAFLDLTDGPSAEIAQQKRAYRELLANDNQLVDDGMGNLVDLLVDSGELDEFDQPIFVPVPVQRSLSPGAASSSGRFFRQFDQGGSHEGWLSPAELKLIAEWVDIGAQYYNNPFDVPGI